MAEQEDRVRVGTVARAHGIRGDLLVAADGETLGSLPAGSTVWLGAGRLATRVTRIRPHQGRWLVTLDAVDDRSAAEGWRGADIMVAAAEVAQLGDSEVWADDLVGYQVLGDAGSVIGVVRAVITASPHDLLEVECGTSRALVPMVRDWLVSLSREDRRITLKVPPGLVEVTAVPGSSGNHEGAEKPS